MATYCSNGSIDSNKHPLDLPYKHWLWLTSDIFTQLTVGMDTLLFI